MDKQINMKRKLNISVPKPCLENYNAFTPSANGGFCKACKKEVIDFTKMTSTELIDYLDKNTQQNLCGKFRSNQLKHYNSFVTKRLKLGYLNGLFLTILSFFSFDKSQAQSYTILPNNPKKQLDLESNIKINGTILDDDNMPLPGAVVMLKNSEVGTTTDFDGNFEFPQKLKIGDVLVISCFGMNTKEIEITNTSKLNISIETNLEFDSLIIVGKVSNKNIYSSKQN